MFKKATKLKYRFPTAKGNISVEDLWDLPLSSKQNPSLDKVAITIDTELESSSRISFVSAPTKTNAELELKLSIVKEIISVKLAERSARKDAAKLKEERELLMELISKKENEALEGETLDALKARLIALD